MSKNTITEFISKMPKIDLHCHIDGSFHPSFVRRTLRLNIEDYELEKQLQAPPDCTTLTEYLTRFELPIQCMQTPKDITEGILDILKRASKEGVAYMELRFAPTCSLNSEQGYPDIYEAAVRGSRLGLTRYGISSNIIICAMRHHPLSDNMNMLHAGMDFLGQGICALDLAGDEKLHGNAEFADLFAEAKRLGMPFTIHSGECGSSDNVRIALDAGAKRVGHGIALIKDSALMQECLLHRLGLELCPTSNYQTGAVQKGAAYPLAQFLAYGLPATVNTDNRTVSNTTMTGEYALICERFEMREEDLLTLYKNSVEISFADDSIKNQLVKLIDKL